MNDNLKAALDYASKGLSVIPVGQSKKPLLITWAEFQKRRATKAEIHQWWTDWPDANVGIVTGEISGISVVDVEKGGETSYLPETATVKTGGGGYHFFYSHLEGLGNKARIRPLTDIRGNGGYVVAAPSLHASGNKYAWVKKMEFTPFPAAMFELQAQNDWSSIVDGKATGSRNETAAKYFGKLFRAFASETWEKTVWPMGKSWNLGNVPPLDEVELRAVYDSIARKALHNPKTQNYVPDMRGVSFITMTDVLNMGETDLMETDDSSCISFGYKFLDDQLTGWFPGELITFGGESGSGKTTLTTNMMYHIARGGVKCAIFALEDRLEDYGVRALFFRTCLEKRIAEGPLAEVYSWNDFRRNRLHDSTFRGYFAKAKAHLSTENIEFAKVEEQMNIDMLVKLIEYQVGRGVGVFLLDHLHVMDLNSGDMSKADYIEQVEVKLKAVMNRTGARVGQVVHYRKLNGAKPSLDSFKDSISIVQNSNYIVNLYRDRSLKDSAEKYKTHFFIPKARNPNGEDAFIVNFDSISGDYDEASARSYTELAAGSIPGDSPEKEE